MTFTLGLILGIVLGFFGPWFLLSAIGDRP